MGGRISRRVICLVVASALAASLGPPTRRADAQSESPVCQGQGATIVGSHGSDRLVGTPFFDVIVGLGGDDHISGLEGRDRICGGPGDDIIRGGPDLDRLDGGPGADRILGGAGRDFIWGGSGPDISRGGRGWDRIDGGAGRDRLYGQRGRDTLTPGAGRDLVNGGRGKDIVSYESASRSIVADLRAGRARGQGRDVLKRASSLRGSEHADVLRGDRGSNLIIGAGGSDKLVGRAGKDRLAGSSGDEDTFRGGRGHDVATHEFAERGVKVNLVRDGHRFRGIEELHGSNSSDVLLGTPGPDIIRGRRGSDKIRGRAGPDRLFGDDGGNELFAGRGHDRVSGGPGRDTIVHGPGKDRIDGGPGDDRYDMSSAKSGMQVDLIAGFAVGGQRNALFEIEDVVGSDHDDVILGSDGENALEGHAGNDHIDGRDGSDYLLGGDGDDLLIGGEGVRIPHPDGLSGQGGDDRLIAGPEGSRMSGGEGNDELEGGAGEDWLIGGDGDDLLNGRAENDELFGSEGNDRLHGGPGDDTLSTGPGQNLAHGGSGTDEVSRGVGGQSVFVDLAAGVMISGGEEDTLVAVENVVGSASDDELYGDDGPNVLDGVLGEDRAFGRGGDDWFRRTHFSDGGPGADLCSAELEHVNCEMLRPGPPPARETRPGPQRPETFWFAPRDRTDPDPALSTVSSVAYQANPSHSGELPHLRLSLPLRERWSSRIRGQASHPLVVDDKVIVFASWPPFGGELYGLSASTGEIVWTRQASARGDIAYDDGRVYLVENRFFGGRVRAFDPSTGAPLWDVSVPHLRELSGSVVAADGALYIGSGNEGAFALDGATGRVLWGREYSVYKASPVLSERRVYATTRRPSAIGFDRSSGAPLWHFDGRVLDPSDVAAAYHEGRLYHPGASQVLDAETGEERGAFRSSQTPALSGSIGVFQNRETPEAYDIYSGARLWSFDSFFLGGLPPLIVGDTVFFASGQWAWALDLTTGAELWRAQIPGSTSRVSDRVLPRAGLGAGPGILVVPGEDRITALEPGS